MDTENDHIIRYCKPSQLDGDNILAGAFILRKKDSTTKRPEDEKELSVFQFEFYSSQEYKHLNEYMNSNGLKTKKNGMFAKLKYSDVKSNIQDNLFLDIDITQNNGDPHCLIQNLYGNDEAAAYCFLECIIDQKRIREI